MTEQPGEGRGLELEPELTKHSTKIRSRDGRSVALSRADGAALFALTITASADTGGAQLTAWLNAAELRALCLNGVERCANCHFSRLDPSGRELRCHRNTPRKRGDEVFFPRVPSGEWCGKYRPMIPAASAAVAA